MAMMQVKNLTFGYEGSYDNVFEDVSFQLDTQWKLGFIGRNGRGKTTFLRLLMGEYEYQGTISVPISFSYFPFSVRNPQWTTQEVIQEISSEIPHWELVRELSLLQIKEELLYRPFETLSKGEQTKIMLAVLFLKDNNFLLIDEPTNHLDIGGRKIVSDYLNSKSGFILVSHDRTFLDGCIDHVLSINPSDITVQKGNFSSWQQNKEWQDSFELEENLKLKKEIKRLEKAAKEKADWSDEIEKTKYAKSNGGAVPPDRGFVGHRAAKMMKRAKAMEVRQSRAIEEKSNLLKNIESKETLKIKQLAYPGKRMLSLRNVSIYYGEKMICESVSFTIEEGDRIALQGRNGSGKSSILKLLYGEKVDYSGDFQKGSQLKISYVPQDTSHLKGNLSYYAVQHGIDESLFKTILRKMDFSRIQFEKEMESFSEGQKKKVLLAHSLCQPAHLYIWDEPLNFVDVLSRMQLEELLLQLQPTILFVEHDRTFCENIATKTVDLG